MIHTIMPNCASRIGPTEFTSARERSPAISGPIILLESLQAVVARDFHTSPKPKPSFSSGISHRYQNNLVRVLSSMNICIICK